MPNEPQENIAGDDAAAAPFEPGTAGTRDQSRNHRPTATNLTRKRPDTATNLTRKRSGGTATNPAGYAD